MAERIATSTRRAQRAKRPKFTSSDIATGMLCPVCQASTLVYDSRTAPGWAVRRRRECCRCKWRFTTYERIEEDFRDWNI